MIVRSFLNWFEHAPTSERCEAVEMMVQCYLSGELGDNTPAEAEAALTLVLDDTATSVRTTLARTLALSESAPRHLIVALAHDPAEAGSIVLARSPLLTDADLIDCARNGAALAHLAIAKRNTVSRRVATVLAEVADPRALRALVENSGAETDDDMFRLMMARHSADPSLREALVGRDDLPADVRQALVAAVASDLLGLVKERGWTETRRVERCLIEARDAATVELAADADNLSRYVTHLGASGQLTPTLLIRSLLTGDASLFGAALVCLADVSPNRVAGMLRSRGAVLAATCVKAGLPRSLVPVFNAALTAIAGQGANLDTTDCAMKRPIIQHVLASCLHEDAAELRPVLAMLRRYDAEVARVEARQAIERLKSTPQVTLEAEIAAPVELEAGDIAAFADASGPVVVDTFEVAPWKELAGANAPSQQDDTLGAGREVRRPPSQLPEDFEKLFAEVFRDELALPPLSVTGHLHQAQDERFFANATPRRHAA